MSIVYFLGAAASVSAGFPTAGRLLSKIGANIEQGADIESTNRWDRVSDFLRGSGSDTTSRLLASSNIEIVFTTIDLLALAEEAEDTDHWQRVRHRGMSDDPFPLDTEGRDKLERHTFLANAGYVKNDLLELIDHYFGWNHYCLSRNPAGRLTSVSDLLADINPEDCVVTTNWDTCLEHVLCADKRWSPYSGYGFPVEVCREHHGQTIELPTELSWLEQVEAVSILKLHGSYGWRLHDHGAIWLQGDGFLQYLPFGGGPMANLRDQRESFPDRIQDSVAAILPSYLKPIGSTSLQSVWKTAAGRPQLPRLVVVDPNPTVHARFKSLLGTDVVSCLQNLETFVGEQHEQMKNT